MAESKNHSVKSGHDDHHDDVYHVTPFSIYLKVAGALFALTFLTVGAHNLHLGAFAAPIAFFIATIKAALVMLWFMHLKNENLTNRVVFASGFFFLFLLFIFCVLDIYTRVAVTNTLN